MILVQQLTGTCSFGHLIPLAAGSADQQSSQCWHDCSMQAATLLSGHRQYVPRSKMKMPGVDAQN